MYTIAAIMHDGLNPVEEPHAGLRHGVPGNRKENWEKDVEKKREKKA